jgi:hypothetical protein
VKVLLLTSGLLVGSVLAALGLWQLTWALRQLSDILPVEPVVRASIQEDVRVELVNAAPPAKLEDPAPIPDLPVAELEAPPPPRCENIFVYIVSVFPRFPELSAASMASGPAARARVRRVGQSIDGWEVAAIRDDWSGLNPQVWLSRAGRLCSADLAGNPARVPPQPPVKKRKRKAKRSK